MACAPVQCVPAHVPPPSCPSLAAHPHPPLPRWLVAGTSATLACSCDTPQLPPTGCTPIPSAARGGSLAPLQLVPAHVTPPSCPPLLPRRLVSGTSLAAVVSTAIASAYAYSSSGCVDLAAAALISPAAMLTAPLGARLTARLDCTALRRILGYFLLAAAPLVPLKASGCCLLCRVWVWVGG